MPRYEYQCTACEQVHEVTASINDPDLASCPSCGGKVRKLFNNVGVVFKGSGFYRTDSRNNSGGTSATSGSTNSSSTSSSSTSSASSSNSSN